jgi:hypothetical protein
MGLCRYYYQYYLLLDRKLRIWAFLTKQVFLRLCIEFRQNRAVIALFIAGTRFSTWRRRPSCKMAAEVCSRVFGLSRCICVSVPSFIQFGLHLPALHAAVYCLSSNIQAKMELKRYFWGSKPSICGIVGLFHLRSCSHKSKPIVWYQYCVIRGMSIFAHFLKFFAIPLSPTICGVLGPVHHNTELVSSNTDSLQPAWTSRLFSPCWLESVD